MVRSTGRLPAPAGHAALQVAGNCPAAQAAINSARPSYDLSFPAAHTTEAGVVRDAGLGAFRAARLSGLSGVFLLSVRTNRPRCGGLPRFTPPSGVDF